MTKDKQRLEKIKKLKEHGLVDDVTFNKVANDLEKKLDKEIDKVDRNLKVVDRDLEQTEVSIDQIVNALPADMKTLLGCNF